MQPLHIHTISVHVSEVASRNGGSDYLSQKELENLTALFNTRVTEATDGLYERGRTIVDIDITPFHAGGCTIGLMAVIKYRNE